MDEATFERETARHRALWDKLRDQIRHEYAGRYVALGEGRILASSANFDDVVAAVEQLRPVPEYHLIFLADDEPVFEPVEDYYQPPFDP
jgi:hypothetical protein